MSATQPQENGTVNVRNAEERGVADFGWLKSRHSFSFGHYHDPQHMGFRALRVINDDRVEPGHGFGTHPHQDMEIVSYVVEGAVEHKDSMGNGSVIRPGDIQLMSAGTGVQHSEFNPSDKKKVHFLQIWILPQRKGLAPTYQQQRFAREDKLNQLRLVASRDGRHGSLTIHQDAEIYASVLEAGQQVHQEMNSKRHIWVQIIEGNVTVNGVELGTGDGAAISSASSLTVDAAKDTELLVFDLV